MYFQKTLAVIGLCALSACGGGSSGGGSLESFAARYAALGSDPSILSGATPNATVDGLNGSASYAGVINIGIDDPLTTGNTSYYGNLDLTVSFSNATTADPISGTAGGFVQFFSEIASPKTGSAVPGSMSLSGNLTGDNTSSLTSGLLGTATGSIDGRTVAYTFDGGLTGVSAAGMNLYFDGTNTVSTGGVGLAVR